MKRIRRKSTKERRVKQKKDLLYETAVKSKCVIL